MTERLTGLDASFLYLDDSTTPMHVGGVQVFELPAGGFGLTELMALVDRRLSLVPRYRQKVRRIPLNLSTPVWVDDDRFDLSYHIRSAALPRPGNDVQLRELVGRLMSHRLDPSRPLWEMTLVEGLAASRFALVTKTHYALVDGIAAIDLGQVILDSSQSRSVPRNGTGDGPDAEPSSDSVSVSGSDEARPWTPRPSPGAARLIAGAVGDALRTPSRVPQTARLGLADAVHMIGKVGSATAGVLSTVRSATRPAPGSPLNTVIGEQRRFAIARTDLAPYRRIRKAYGVTVNDVVLATVSGALRDWLLTRGRPVTPSSVVRAMVPVSVRDGAVSAYLVDLPVGEPNPVVRLHQVAYAMRGHQENVQPVGADALVRLTGFAPPTLHALGARAASQLSKRLFNLVITNVPGPQTPLYADGARMVEVFPVVPLAKGQAVSIGLTSYNGRVYYGFNADRDSMPDVEVLAGLVTDALLELGETVR